MKRLTLGQYRKMVDTVLEFKELNGRYPAYTDVEGCRINKNEYIDLIDIVNKFLLEMGRSPEALEIGYTDGKSEKKALIH